MLWGSIPLPLYYSFSRQECQPLGIPAFSFCLGNRRFLPTALTGGIPPDPLKGEGQGVEALRAVAPPLPHKGESLCPYSF